jgi:hypothetical protein
MQYKGHNFWTKSHGKKLFWAFDYINILYQMRYKWVKTEGDTSGGSFVRWKHRSQLRTENSRNSRNMEVEIQCSDPTVVFPVFNENRPEVGTVGRWAWTRYSCFRIWPSLTSPKSLIGDWYFIFRVLFTVFVQICYH